MPRVSTNDLSQSASRTRAIHAGQEPDPVTGAILQPIVQSTTFVQRELGSPQEFAYSRVSNPTVAALERALGGLEDAPPAVAFSTGLSATASLFLSLLKSGDHVVISDVVYGGTTRLLQQILAPLGVTATFVDTSDAAVVDAAITPETKVLFIETPANPTLKLTDIAAVSRAARARGVKVIVDNTFLTAILQRPLDLGADASLYSTTKFIEGHNATVGGAVVSRDTALLERLRFIRKSLGTIQAPFEAWLTLRGIKTLPLRIREHSTGAAIIARYLEAHPAVERVHYPGLASFPQAELAARQHVLAGTGRSLHGGIVSFEIRGGIESARRFVNTVRLISLAENCGAVESLVTHSASMTHADVPREQRLAAGITDGLVRLSVGLEDPIDLINDIEQALNHSPQRHGEHRDGAGEQSGVQCRNPGLDVEAGSTEAAPVPPGFSVVNAPEEVAVG